jgi:hypothetical protein
MQAVFFKRPAKGKRGRSSFLEKKIRRNYHPEKNGNYVVFGSFSSYNDLVFINLNNTPPSFSVLHV